MTDEMWLEGAVAVSAAVETGSRDILELLVDAARMDGAVARLERAAAAAGATVRRLPAAELANRAGMATRTGLATHSGILARVGPKRMLSLDELLEQPAVPAVLMLDGVEDPYNFGQAVRAAYACGITGLIVQPRNWLSAAAVVARASAGATERMPTALAATPEEAAVACRARGLLVGCATPEKSVDARDVDLARPLLLVIGGEKRGISRSLLAAADVRLRIPYGRAFDQSLGTAAATAILSYELMRQRNR
jgi:23S rRNA (guanosine2251-2'-O)-methyltransferase